MMSAQQLSQVRLHRRGAVAAIAVGTGLLVGGMSGRAPLAAHAAAAPALASGALGLTRSEIEAMWGGGEGPFAGQGHYFDVHDLYTYQATGETYHIAYQQINGIEIAVYVQVDWLGDGVTQGVARETVAGLIPDDARLTDLYTAPPTPGGPIAFSVTRYASEALGSPQVHSGALAPEILVVAQERWGDPSVANSSSVISLSIAVRERTQLTP